MKPATVRIYQLARELNLSSTEVVKSCNTLRFQVKAATSSLSQEEAEKIRRLYAGAQSNGLVPNLEQEATPVSPDLYSAQYYFNREISWLRFNERVLHEALDARNLLLERLKFLAIFSSNLDEYFMARVAGLKQQVDAQITQRTQDGMTPQEQLDAIHNELKPMVAKQHRYFVEDLKPQLEAAGIRLLDYQQLSDRQVEELRTYFLEQIFPVLTPLAVDPGHPFPYISSLSLNLAVVVRDRICGESHFARVKVPDALPRFISLSIPKGTDVPSPQWWAVPIEQVIAQNLQCLFNGMDIEACYPFRITRNADFEIEEDEADDLLIAIEQELRKRRFGSVVRMEIQVGMPNFIRNMLIEEMDLGEADVYTVEGLLCLSDLFAIAGLPFPELKSPPWNPITPSRLRRLEAVYRPEERLVAPGKLMEEEQTDIFAIIRSGDLLVHHPYESFAGSVLRFITEAAYDPNVLSIKMTLYRTAGDSKFVDSPIVSSLIAAAENGKQVVALVELKARFDEENNIIWARKLEKVGVHVVYGLVGLKTHTKITMVVRREGQQLRRYVHIGTGNYNPRTARLYTDLGLFSCREDIGADLTDLFNYLTGFSRQEAYRKLLVAPVNLRDRMLALIQQEVDLQKQGKQGHIMIKMNSLIDPDLIAALYRASQAGVQVDAIVRGICSLRPGLEGISENIRVISLIGLFLEHDRIFYFHNDGNPKVYIGSADWRPRNLDRRVEAVVPIEDPILAGRLREMLDLCLSDNRQAWDLQADGQFIQRRPAEGEPERSVHQLLMQTAVQSSQLSSQLKG
jgi:polyphosphate kinase